MSGVTETQFYLPNTFSPQESDRLCRSYANYEAEQATKAVVAILWP